MSLAKDLLNNKVRLEALLVPEEVSEVKAVLSGPRTESKGPSMPIGRVLLKRTFNQSDFEGGMVRYWRVVGPVGHANYMSDLSVEGLRDWGIIAPKGI
jgi:hypothetical protein